MKTLRQAAEAVVDSWDATYIAALRTTLEAPESEPEIKVLQAKCDAFFANTQLALEELEDMTAKRDIAIRKLSVLDNAHFLENLYEVGLNQERDITRLTAERDAYQKAADSMAMAHKVERDELQSRINQQASMVEKSIETMNRNAEIGTQAGKERDALLLANLDLKDWFDALKADYDKLMVPALKTDHDKLMVLALKALEHCAASTKPANRPLLAITALKQAGVK